MSVFKNRSNRKFKETHEGTIAEEFPNGAYVIHWNIIDGHPIEGEVPFELGVKASADEPAAGSSPSAAGVSEVSPVPKEMEPNEGNSWVTILVGVVFLTGLFSSYKLWKKK